MSRIFRSLPPKGTALGIAFSGGLDTRCAVAWLSEQGLAVHAYTADLAQPDEANPSDIPPIAYSDKKVGLRVLIKGMLLAIELIVRVDVERRYPLRILSIQSVRQLNEPSDLTLVPRVDLLDLDHAKLLPKE